MCLAYWHNPLHITIFEADFSRALRSSQHGYPGPKDIISKMGTRFEYSSYVQALEKTPNLCESAVGLLNNLLSAELLGKGVLSMHKMTLPVYETVLEAVTPLLVQVLMLILFKLFSFICLALYLLSLSTIGFIALSVRM